MSERRPFLLRIDSQVLDAMQRWADGDLRSLNGQIEFVLRRVLIEEGRLKDDSSPEGEAKVRRPERGHGRGA